MDNPSDIDKKSHADKNDPFSAGMALWENYISNLFSVYTQSIDDIQRINQIYRESVEITKEMGNLYKDLATRIENMNKLYSESVDITERMNKFWMDNIWKPFLSYKEKEKK